MKIIGRVAALAASAALVASLYVSGASTPAALDVSALPVASASDLASHDAVLVVPTGGNVSGDWSGHIYYIPANGRVVRVVSPSAFQDLAGAMGLPVFAVHADTFETLLRANRQTEPE